MAPVGQLQYSSFYNQIIDGDEIIRVINAAGTTSANRENLGYLFAFLTCSISLRFCKKMEKNRNKSGHSLLNLE